MTGTVWTITNPQGLDASGVPQDMYIRGGIITTTEISELNAVGVYNVGWGTLSMFDNVMVQSASAVIPEPSTFMLSVMGALGLGMLARRRRRQR